MSENRHFSLWQRLRLELAELEKVKTPTPEQVGRKRALLNAELNARDAMNRFQFDNAKAKVEPRS